MTFLIGKIATGNSEIDKIKKACVLSEFKESV